MTNESPELDSRKWSRCRHEYARSIRRRRGLSCRDKIIAEAIIDELRENKMTEVLTRTIQNATGIGSGARIAKSVRTLVAAGVLAGKPGAHPKAAWTFNLPAEACRAFTVDAKDGADVAFTADAELASPVDAAVASDVGRRPASGVDALSIPHTAKTPHKTPHSRRARTDGVLFEGAQGKNGQQRPGTAADAAALVYSAYPRKVARGPALAAITKALKAIAERGEADPAAWLLERVKAFATSPAGQCGRFVPYPASWFNAARFDDDANEWNRTADRPNGRNGHGNNGRHEPDAELAEITRRMPRI